MDETRPTKRQKVVPEFGQPPNPVNRITKVKSGDLQRSKSAYKKRFHDQEQRKKSSGTRQTDASGDNLNQKRNAAKQSGRTFSQPSTMRAGSRGILVTCNKGAEKKSLLELLDLVQPYLTTDTSTESTNQSSEQEIDRVQNIAGHSLAPVALQAHDIENDIETELASLQCPQLPSGLEKSAGLITLDIPCVSYLQLPSSIIADPVDIVQGICISAAANSSTPRSRFIRRLTPVSSLQKVLNDGLEKLCKEILPKHFLISDHDHAVGIDFAIKPTVRNNDKLNRDEIIRTVAEHVNELGKGKHKVNLKHYHLGILVDVYRTWVGMSVVRNEQPRKRSDNSTLEGYEELKKYNLAELYIQGLPS